MKGISRYLPSSQFALILVSVLLSTGLVFAADRITHPSYAPARVVVASPNDVSNTNWESTLYAIQAQNASTAIPPTDQNAVADMLAAAQSPNLTDTVGRTLLVNLGSANAQGLGSDIPTQDQIVAAAQTQIDATRPAAAYTNKDLVIVEDTKATEQAYGNALVSLLLQYPHANHQEAMAEFGVALEDNNPNEVGALAQNQDDYRALLKAYVATPVPQTLAPLHLQVVQNLSKIVASLSDMQQMFSDPLRAVAGMQTLESASTEIGGLFTTIAQSFTKNGILFNKDEPGRALNVLISS